jgi:signal transduction histidine kinase
VCDILKADPEMQDVPVIFVTAKNDAESESRALGAGAVDFIHKPINHEVVRARVQLHLAVKSRERELRELNADLEQKVIERTRALSEALIVAEDAARAKSDFLANMSHEIRTPMNTIIGITYLTLQTEISQKQRDYLTKIQGSSQHLLGIINGILDLSKVQAGKMLIEHIEFQLQHVIRNVTDQIANSVISKGIALTINVGSDVPAHLWGDPLRLGQILINYASNAVKFTQKGEIGIHVALVKATPKEALLRFSVHDTGIGISEVQRQRLFNDFQQADTSTTRQYGGTGLGLSIVKRMVELMGGEFGLESELGQGSTFWFTAPLGQQDGRPRLPTGQTIALPLIKTAPDNPLPINAQERVQLTRVCRKLAEQLGAGEFAATALLERHSDLLRSAFGPDHTRLVRAVSQFDFEAALALLQQAAKTHNIGH